MTSGKFQPVAVSSIIINRDQRQRRQLENIDELAESIQRIGLINPIVITKEGVLVAGERRLTAIRSLGWTHVTAQYVEDLDDLELHVLELEENVRREDLSWQDKCLAIKRYHELKKEMADGKWTDEDTANSLGFHRAHVAKNLLVADALKEGNERVASADKFSVALGITQREKERKATSILDSISISPSIDPDIEEVEDEVREVLVKPVAPILHADFHEWAAGYCERKFNMIHCDFPYGVNMQDSDQGGGAAYGTYADTPDVYWTLIDTLEMAMSNVVADSAHLIFWFSMDFYDETLRRLTAMGWRVNPFPLVWMKNDNTGILPDAKRGPRRIYETAFFASRGDRVLATGPHGQGPVANAFAYPGRGKSIHMNEKPVEMIRHFMRLCVDEYSTVLDPTCGSASALKAAESLGAASVLGLERDPEFFALASDNYFPNEQEDIDA